MGLSNRNSQLLAYRQRTSGTHRLISTIRTFTVLQLVATNVGNDGVSVCNSTPNSGFVRSILMSVRNGWACVHPGFGLEVEGQQSSCRGDRTHVKDTKSPVEIQLPGGDRLFIFLRMIASRDCIPFTSLDDVPLDLVDNPDRELDEENTSHTHR